MTLCGKQDGYGYIHFTSEEMESRRFMSLKSPGEVLGPTIECISPSQKNNFL